MLLGGSENQNGSVYEHRKAADWECIPKNVILVFALFRQNPRSVVPFVVNPYSVWLVLRILPDLKAYFLGVGAALSVTDRL